MRYMGLDVGSRTIGIAVSDLLGFTAQGVTTIRRKSLEYDLTELQRYQKDYQVESFVVGLPKNMDGSLGPTAQAIQEFAQALEERFDLPVLFWDERLTTVSATRVLLEGDVSRKKRKQVVDKLAAVFILQGFLDSLSYKN